MKFWNKLIYFDQWCSPHVISSVYVHMCVCAAVCTQVCGQAQRRCGLVEKEVITAQMGPLFCRPLYFTDSASTDKPIVLVRERTSVVVSWRISVRNPLLSYPMNLRWVCRYISVPYTIGWTRSWHVGLLKCNVFIFLGNLHNGLLAVTYFKYYLAFLQNSV